MAAPEYIAALSEWLHDCLSNHARCHFAISSSTLFNPRSIELPTRCIEVTPTAAYLRDTQGTIGSYVTLSHRWNPEAEAVKTTSANFQQRMSGTELGLLSKTFEDAIMIVRKLEIRYIWIDTICIIQGTDDWNQEKFKMGQYYERALFTISAIGGSIQAGKDSGILKSQPPKSLVRLAFKEIGIRKGSVFLYRRDDKALFLTDVARSELISRGWVFQERLLRFSKTILTQQSDHLAAISGAAFEYGGAIERQRLKKGDKRCKNTKPKRNYLSGLWLEDIHYGLMWFAVDHQNRECPCGAPSWSWLSNQGEVEWQRRDDMAQPSLHVLGAECEEETQGVRRLPEVVIMTTKLCVKAKMQPLLIMPGIQDAKGMSVLTGVKVETSPCNQYYTICHPTSPDWAGGWAKFERDPRVAELNNTSSGIGATLAIHVASRQADDKAGLIEDFLNLRRTVYEVIFVKCVKDQTFQRLGAGFTCDLTIAQGTMVLFNIYIFYFWLYLAAKALTKETPTNVDRKIFTSRGRYDIR
ncbi:het-domain-containing protein [Fusarium coicis]|nr:het-domain-containing protein [Fusarium coicis]